jgi:hypothetical protein
LQAARAKVRSFSANSRALAMGQPALRGVLGALERTTPEPFLRRGHLRRVYRFGRMDLGHQKLVQRLL